MNDEALSLSSLRVPPRRGFTLIELLVVIAVIAILIALLFPVAGRMFENAKLAQCQGNLRQIGIGMNGFIADNGGKYPLARSYTERGTGWEGPFWSDRIEPYTESESAEHLKHQGRTGESIFYCPSFPRHHGISDYGVNPRVILHPNHEDKEDSRGLPAVRVQRPAGTVLAVDSGRLWQDTGELIGGWSLPNGWIVNPPEDPLTTNGPQPVHNGQLNVLFCDGRVESMSYPQLLDLHPEAFEVD